MEQVVREAMAAPYDTPAGKKDLPVVGSGKRLFEEHIPRTDLVLTKTDACANGATMNIYRRAESAARNAR